LLAQGFPSVQPRLPRRNAAAEVADSVQRILYNPAMTMQLGMLGMHHPHAHGIVRQVAEHPDEFRLAGCFDSDPRVAGERARQWASQIAGLRIFDRVTDLLALPLDGVIVEGRVHENLELARAALRRGLPVMLEKPAGTDLQQFQQVADLARQRNLRLQMIYLFRYMSAVQEMLRLARNGELGGVYQFRARLPKDLRLYDEHVQRYACYRGGIFFEMAGHVIDMMVAILGPPRSVTPLLAHHHDAPNDFIDDGLAVFQFDRAWGTIEVNALEIATDQRRIEVYGTAGACVIPNLGSGHLANEPVQPIDVYHPETGWTRRNLPAATLQIADLREFAACVRGEKPSPDFDLEHDLAVQETLLRACGG
jgi:predicted dehydrogenase